MPILARIPMAVIDEPQLPIREAMDEEKLRELAESIRVDGLLQPVGLKRMGERYEIIFGHRRFMAHQLIHAVDIESKVFEPGEVTDGSAMLAENLYREDLSDAETAQWLVDLRDRHGFDEAALCKAVKKSPDWIADRIRLFDGDEDVFKALSGRKINFSVARELNKCKDDSMRNYFLQQAIMSTPPARVVAQWVSSHVLSTLPAGEQNGAPLPPVQHDQIAPQQNCCATCGGNKDPYNLIFVQIHKHCWEQIEKAIAASAAE